MKLTDIRKCEKQNENIAVNVLGYERDFIHSRSTKRKIGHILMFFSYQIYITA